MAASYYLRDHQGNISGPFSGADLKKMVREGRLDLSWHISADKAKWHTAAAVRGLFGDVDKVISDSLPRGNEYRNFTPKEVVGLFVDEFVLKNENLNNSYPFLKELREWWAKLTLPKDFVITEVTAAGVRHVKYDVGSGEAHTIERKEVEKNISDGVKQFNWFKYLSMILGAVWLVWTAKDFVVSFSLTWATLKTVLLAGIALTGFIYKTKTSKVFVGYKLDSAALRRLEQIAEAISVLRNCSHVWMYRVEQSEGKQHWKYNAGDTFKVTRLPLAVFKRTIPNVQTNVRVHGITCSGQAIYFLPDEILLIDKGQVKNVPYPDLQVTVDSLEYVESEGQVYGDSEVIAHRWKFINRDGSQDRRFKENIELPVVRCGILVVGVGETELKMMTTNPKAPEVIREKLRELKATTPPMVAASPVSPAVLPVEGGVHVPSSVSPPSPPSQGVPVPVSVAPATKACPFCAEQILAAAKKCKHCGEFLDSTLQSVKEPRRPSPRTGGASDGQ